MSAVPTDATLRRGDTYSSSQQTRVGGVLRKIKTLTRRGTTSLSLAEVLRTTRSCAAAGRPTPLRRLLELLLPWQVCLVEIDLLNPPQTPHLTWKQVQRRYCGADRIRDDDLVLYNPAKMREEL
jgi:RNA-directed DNA polymerase